MTVDKDLVLYHGSYTAVERPDLNECRKGKDFGRGFYLTSSKKQAERFTRTSIKKALLNGLIPKNTKKGFVSSFKIESAFGLNIYTFDNADEEWLHCVVGHRKYGSFPDEISKWEKYDLIIGKIANDNTNLVITAYMDGVYGEVGSDKADRLAISFLEPENLKNQYCFRTEQAIQRLQYLGCEEVKL